MKRGVGQNDGLRPTRGSAATRRRRATVLLMIVGLLAMLFMLVSAFIVLARFERQTVQMMGQADQITQILDSITDVAVGAIRGPSGSDLVSGAAYVDYPGAGDPNDPSWGSPWLASAEPVHDPASGTYLPEDYRLPAVSGFTGPADPNDPNAVPLTRLMLDDPNDGYVYVDPSQPLLGDTPANVRQPFADANGDGIPDSLFSGAGLLTELANAMGGRAVHATGIDPSVLGGDAVSSDLLRNIARWQQYDSTARYAVAENIISHGGMVQVSAPTNQVMWNSTFTQGMFSWIRHPTDPARLPPEWYALLQAMGAQSASVEPVLRRRGGLLAGSRGNSQDGVPPALWELQQQFSLTFAPNYQQFNGRNNWQRFNLADANDWDAWRYAVAIDAPYYNSVYPNDAAARNYYVPRQILTTVNNSDELARIETAKTATWSGLGLRPGALKFYLGRIASAFDVNGHYDGLAGGPAVVGELANYYYEMLGSYSDWYNPNDPNTLNDPNGVYEAVSRSRQAYMLAVNTVAFAAPRDVNGNVDAVYYDSTSTDPNDAARYIGYAPQPFITQVVAYNNPGRDPNDPNEFLAQVALAIELYNPNEPGFGDLDTTRFAVSVCDPNDASTCDAKMAEQLSTLPPVTGLIPGRSFLLLAVNDQGANTYFDDQTYDHYPTKPLLIADRSVSAKDIRVGLWRATSTAGAPSVDPGGWYLVDEMVLDPNEPNDPGEKWWENVQRDCTWEPYLGVSGPTSAPGRWRMPVAFDPNDPEYADMRGTNDPSDPNGFEPAGILYELGSAFRKGADNRAGPPPTSYAPSVPLYLMNAGALPSTAYPIHGAVRPASFPTVGFMLYVPRFSHMITATTREPMGTVLRDEWAHRHFSMDPNSPVNPNATYPPADFGHMPVFDNEQKVASDSAFADTRMGRVPWGQLVFDYFTTLDPNDPNDPVDPYRVPGRININDASWYVLAGLPVIGPLDAANPLSTNLPLDRNASPAFWDASSGILAGIGGDGATARYPGAFLDARSALNGQWYRLGPNLGQAAAAYRDRTAYIQGDAISTPLGLGWQRNDPNSPAQLRYRPIFYGPDDEEYSSGIRRGGALSKARGFLTLGELANVIAFDGSTGTEITGDNLQAGSTVLGGYGYGAGGDFMKAVSLLALLDTHFLTTRSNTFTVYTTLFDRENPQASVRSQVTVDRSNLLPRLVTNGGNSVTLPSDGSPELIARREYSYFNSQYDQ
jgi:hypothetical protein